MSTAAIDRFMIWLEDQYSPAINFRHADYTPTTEEFFNLVSQLFPSITIAELSDRMATTKYFFEKIGDEMRWCFKSKNQ